jgi:hypothetical protein
MQELLAVGEDDTVRINTFDGARRCELVDVHDREEVPARTEVAATPEEQWPRATIHERARTTTV